MNKQEFLTKLENALSGLPREDIEERIEFYDEMIDDRMEEGLSEEEAVAEIGAVESIVPQILEEIPITKIVKERVRPKRQLSTIEIILLVLGSPLWIAILVVIFSLVLSLYVVIWSLAVTLWAVELSFIVSAAACVIAGIVMIAKANALAGAALISAGLVLAGLSIFLFYGCIGLTKGIAILTKNIALGIKSLFVRRDTRAYVPQESYTGQGKYDKF